MNDIDFKLVFKDNGSWLLREKKKTLHNPQVMSDEEPGFAISLMVRYIKYSKLLITHYNLTSCIYKK